MIQCKPNCIYSCSTLCKIGESMQQNEFQTFSNCFVRIMPNDFRQYELEVKTAEQEVFFGNFPLASEKHLHRIAMAMEIRQL